MKSYRTFLMTLLLTMFLFFISNLCAEIKLYDDFSTGYIDGGKWRQREYVREIIDGEFVFKLGNRSPGMGAEGPPGYFCNDLPFANPETINSIEVDVTIVETQLDSAPGSKSFIRIHGRYYNRNQEGGASGNIIAQLMIGEQGNGKVEAFWEVWETTSDDNSTWDVIGNGTISDFDSTIITPPYNVKLLYDGDNTFVFTINDTYTDSFSGPEKRREALDAWKVISAGIRADNGLNNGFVHGKIDNVYIYNGSEVYDDFSSPMIDLSKWNYAEFIREASNGYLRANIIGFGSTRIATTHLSYKSAPFFESKVRIDSTSQLSQGAYGVGRLQGYYYNDSRGPDSGLPYNLYEGDVFAQIRLKIDSDGALLAEAFIHRSNDANESSFTELFHYIFTTTILIDTYYTLSIQFEGDQLIFGCDGEMVSYDIGTPVYPAYGIHRHLRSVIYLDSEESGYINASYDDVTVETCLCDLKPFDGDVDGSDIVAYITDDEGISLRDFANEFGQISCP